MTFWAHWLERLYNLRRDKRGGHERPHKPVLLLLSILDLLDRGLIVANEIPLSEELVATFKRYFPWCARPMTSQALKTRFTFSAVTGSGR